MAYNLKELEQSMTYTDEQLHYLRSKLDKGAVECFQMVVEASGDPYGLLRTKIEDFKDRRRMYDLGFTILLAQGFIRAKEMGNMRPYFLTVRGEQLNELLNSEKRALNSEE